ncbi:MAG: DUF6125 family protein [Desulfobacterales bacterium]|jgi:hypothetical protein
MEPLKKEELIELLNKCWMTHDGMWFYHCLQEFGIAKANKLNKAAIKSLAPIETGRIKRTLGIEKQKIETFAEFTSFFKGAAELFIPDFMKISLSFPDENVLHWEFEPQKCFAYRGMQKMGVVAEYECGVIYRVECWIASLGITYNVVPQIKKCIMLTHDTCCGDIRLQFNEN